MALTKFEITPVPVLKNIAEVPEHLPEMIDGNLGVISIRHTTEAEFLAMTPLQETLSEHGLAMTQRPIRHVRNRAFHRVFGSGDPHADPNPYGKAIYHDIGLHTDAGYNPSVTELTVHRTRLGRATALFFEFQPAAFGTPLGPRNTIFEAETRAIKRGYVDDEQFIPIGHIAHTRPGTTLIFRRAGFSPLAHMFTSSPLSWRRQFDVKWLSNR